MATSSVAEVALELAPWQQLQLLLDASYPHPPRDVFERVVAASHIRQRLWLASDADGLVGLVMLSPHSKGGHLENLAVAASTRGPGVGQQLFPALVQDIGHEGPAMVSSLPASPASSPLSAFSPTASWLMVPPPR